MATSETCAQHKLNSICQSASPDQGTAPRTSMAECRSKQKAAPGLWLGGAHVQLAGRKACVCPQQGGSHALQVPATEFSQCSTGELLSSLCICTMSVQSIMYTAHGAEVESRASDRFFCSYGHRTQQQEWQHKIGDASPHRAASHQVVLSKGSLRAPGRRLAAEACLEWLHGHVHTLRGSRHGGLLHGQSTQQPPAAPSAEYDMQASRVPSSGCSLGET